MPASTAAAPSTVDQPAVAAAVAAGGTVWLTGLPSAGKSTVACAVADLMRARGRRVEVLDGDAVRETLCADLGFSRADRDTNVARIGYVAALLARHGVLVLAAVISPYARARDAVRARHDAEVLPFLEVHVATAVHECAARDAKGLYARAYAGQIRGLTGVDDAYEPPPAPQLRLDTAGVPVAESAAAVLDLLEREGLA